jgi:hypothetical protein
MSLSPNGIEVEENTGPPRACGCREGIIEKLDGEGRKIEVETGLHVHDCQYIIERNALIPQAEKAAWVDDGKGRINFSSAEFRRKMDELVRQKIHER